ncbi:hypothetical protein LQZ19_00850 [Treponema primitia]|uniref:hypothetical protein n=1 Tax=Treponema primitia TaxID=88058 RepID=UPI00398094B7
MGSDSSERDVHEQDVREQDVLNHLLKVESQAAILVDDAQAEADRRVAEKEKENRARCDERYSLEAAELNGEYEKAVLAVKEDYKRQMEANRESLEVMPVHGDAFSQLAERLFFGER